METSRFAWRASDLIPFVVLGVASLALPFIPFLNEPGIVLLAYLAICGVACYLLVRFPEDNRPDQARDTTFAEGNLP